MAETLIQELEPAHLRGPGCIRVHSLHHRANSHLQPVYCFVPKSSFSDILTLHMGLACLLLAVYCRQGLWLSVARTNHHSSDR